MANPGQESEIVRKRLRTETFGLGPGMKKVSPFPGLQCFSGYFLQPLVYRNVFSIGLARGAPLRSAPRKIAPGRRKSYPSRGVRGRSYNKLRIFAGPIPRNTVFSSAAPHAGNIPIHTNKLCSRCRTRLGSPFDPLGPGFDLLPANFSLMWPYKCIKGIRRHRRTESPAVLHSQGLPPFAPCL